MPWEEESVRVPYMYTHYNAVMNKNKQENKTKRERDDI